MNVPNKLTISRFVLTALSSGRSFRQLRFEETIALALFSAAGLTDYFDGKIARRDNLITNFGILMDPLADKILVCSAFIAFVGRSWMPAWMVGRGGGAGIGHHRIAIVGSVEKSGAGGGGIRQTQNHFTNRRHHFDSVFHSYQQWGAFGRAIFGLQLPPGWPWVEWFAPLSLWVAVILTFTSGAIYLWRNCGLVLVGFMKLPEVR